MNLHPLRREAILSLTLLFFLAGGLAGTARGQFGVGYAPAPLAEPSRFDTLMDLIRSTAAPDTWDEVGGPGSIQPVDEWGVIVVSQTPQVHEQIETLIRVFRKARREQEAGRDMTPPKERPEEKLPASLVVESEAEVEARRRIEAVLSEKTDLNFQETPINDVVAALADRHKIPIVLDRRAMDDVGIGVDEPITQHIEGVSLRSALRIMLREFDMGYWVRDETLQLTTTDVLDANLVTRVYKVRDLASPEK
ncbi:MAG: hypothetical protein RIC55_06635 [Pirellulaceae bacterium]